MTDQFENSPGSGEGRERLGLRQPRRPEPIGPRETRAGQRGTFPLVQPNQAALTQATYYAVNGQKLYDARMDHNPRIRQSDLADFLQVTQAFVSQIETDRRLTDEPGARLLALAVLDDEDRWRELVIPTERQFPELVAMARRAQAGRDQREQARRDAMLNDARDIAANANNAASKAKNATGAA